MTGSRLPLPMHALYCGSSFGICTSVFSCIGIRTANGRYIEEHCWLSHQDCMEKQKISLHSLKRNAYYDELERWNDLPYHLAVLEPFPLDKLLKNSDNPLHRLQGAFPHFFISHPPSLNFFNSRVIISIPDEKAFSCFFYFNCPFPLTVN